MCRTTPFQNPATARTAGRCDRPEAPPATPAFILLFLSPPSSLPETWKSAGESGPNRWRKPHVILPFEEEGQCRCEVSRSFATQPQQGLRLGFVGMDASPPPFVQHSGSQGQTGAIFSSFCLSANRPPKVGPGLCPDLRPAYSRTRCLPHPRVGRVSLLLWNYVRFIVP